MQPHRKLIHTIETTFSVMLDDIAPTAAFTMATKLLDQREELAFWLDAPPERYADAFRIALALTNAELARRSHVA